MCLFFSVFSRCKVSKMHHYFFLRGGEVHVVCCKCSYTLVYAYARGRVREIQAMTVCWEWVKHATPCLKAVQHGTRTARPSESERPCMQSGKKNLKLEPGGPAQGWSNRCWIFFVSEFWVRTCSVSISFAVKCLVLEIARGVSSVPKTRVKSNLSPARRMTWNDKFPQVRCFMIITWACETQADRLAHPNFWLRKWAGNFFQKTCTYHLHHLLPL